MKPASKTCQSDFKIPIKAISDEGFPRVVIEHAISIGVTVINLATSDADSSVNAADNGIGQVLATLSSTSGDVSCHKIEEIKAILEKVKESRVFHISCR